MKTMNICLFISILALTGCGESKIVSGAGAKPAVVHYSAEQALSLKKLIGKKNYEILVAPDSVKISTIEHVPVKGTENEYGRKTELIRVFKIDPGGFSKNILKDENYHKIKARGVQFDPNFQFELKRKDQKLSLLLDGKTGILSFMTLQGQIVLGISEALKEELMEMAKKKK